MKLKDLILRKKYLIGNVLLIILGLLGIVIGLIIDKKISQKETYHIVKTDYGFDVYKPKGCTCNLCKDSMCPIHGKIKWYERIENNGRFKKDDWII